MVFPQLERPFLKSGLDMGGNVLLLKFTFAILHSSDCFTKPYIVVKNLTATQHDRLHKL